MPSRPAGAGGPVSIEIRNMGSGKASEVGKRILDGKLEGMTV